jgi:hypothetical protein
MKAAGLPLVVILISGRPMILDRVLEHCDAMIAAWLPGTEGRGLRMCYSEISNQRANSLIRGQGQ